MSAYVRSAATSQTAVASTNHDVLMPAQVKANDLLVHFYTNDGSGALTVASLPTGWSSDVISGGSQRMFVTTKLADGTEGGTTVTFVGGSDESCSIVYAVAEHDINTPPEFAVVGNSADPGAVTPVNWDGSVEDWLVLCVINCATSSAAFTPPSGYSNLQTSGVATNVVGTNGAEKKISGSSSENPGVWGTSSGASSGIATIAIRSRRSATQSSPEAIIALAAVSTTSAPIPPGARVNDVAVCFMESGGGSPAVTGWTQIGTTEAFTGGAQSIWWLRLAHSDITGVTAAALTGGTDHKTGRVVVFRGCKQSGTPFEAVAQGHENTVDTSLNATGLTTTADGRLVVIAANHNLDIATANFSGWTNADLALIRELIDDSSVSGNGGGVGVAVGRKATAGTVTASSATLATGSEKSFFEFGVIPEDYPTFYPFKPRLVAMY